jgi:hypothetical protein
MSFDIEQFRLDFPEFAIGSPYTYTDEMITFWAGIGDQLLNTERWATLRTYGLELFVAHNITLQMMNIGSVAAGESPGTATGLINSQGAGGISIGIDTQAIIEKDGGDYNSTQYGRQFLRLSRIIGMGGSVV